MLTTITKSTMLYATIYIQEHQLLSHLSRLDSKSYLMLEELGSPVSLLGYLFLHQYLHLMLLCPTA